MNLPKYAMFVAATPNYMKALNALLNSIEKRRLYRDCYLDVYVFYYGAWDNDYVMAAQRAYTFPVKFVRIMERELGIQMKTIEYVKRIRYHKITEYAGEYDAVCMLDCDMFFVSDQFMRLFDMVNNTRLLIGCNEKFKWETGPYTIDGKKIIEPSGKMLQFLCNTPAIFCMKNWEEVFKKYIDIAINGRQEKGGNIVGIGDIMCWNLAIKASKREDDVVMFPMETMAQVHYTNMRAWTYPIVGNDYWRTEAGDRIYVIHGRVGREGFIEGCMKKYYQLQVGRPDIDKVAVNVRKGLLAIEKEWVELGEERVLS